MRSPSPSLLVLALQAGTMLLGLGVLVGTGCAPSQSYDERWTGIRAPTPTNAVAAPPAPSPKPAAPKTKALTLAPQVSSNRATARYPVVTPLVGSIGRVLTVNTQAQFVVVDFSFTPVPRPDRRLTVLRAEQAVGTVRVTGAPRGSLMAADIMSGEAQVGDEVRETEVGP